MGLFSTGKGAVTRAAQDTAAAQQGRASNLTTFIDNVFSSPNRANQITDFMGALRSQLGDVTNKGYTNTARQTKFATARQGLTGGSTDLSRQSLNLQDLFDRRLSDESQVQDAGNQLRTQDQATRQSLINQAYGVADVGQQATQNMIAQQGQNANYLSTLFPKALLGLGNNLAGGYDMRKQLQGYSAGAGA